MIRLGKNRTITIIIAISLLLCGFIVWFVKDTQKYDKAVYLEGSSKSIAASKDNFRNKCYEEKLTPDTCDNIEYNAFRITWCNSKGVCWVVDAVSKDRKYSATSGVANEDGNFRVLDYFRSKLGKME